MRGFKLPDKSSLFREPPQGMRLANRQTTELDFQAMAATPHPRPGQSGGRLPDSARTEGPFRAFASDPGWSEAWWWLALPVLSAIALIGVYTLNPDFYNSRILPEGYGALELSQFFIALAGMILALRLVFHPAVRARRLLFVFCILSALACLYIAGEEHSWGQHFFQWQTPEYWAQINRQQETNLHNTLHLFDKKPRLVLELGVLIGGLLIPLAARFRPAIRRMRWSLFFPADAMVPTALCAVLFKITDSLQDAFGIYPLAARPSESIEFYLYLFILFYLVVLTRRIGELENEQNTAR